MADEVKKESKESKMSAKVEKIAKEVEALSALELSELASHLEEKFGVSAMPMASTGSAASASASGDATADKEEKSIFTVTLVDGGANKLEVIKAVRLIKPDLGLMDAKKMVDTLPAELLKDAKKDAAEDAKKKIETAGGKVEMK